MVVPLEVVKIWNYTLFLFISAALSLSLLFIFRRCWSTRFCRCTSAVRMTMLSCILWLCKFFSWESGVNGKFNLIWEELKMQRNQRNWQMHGVLQQTAGSDRCQVLRGHSSIAPPSTWLKKLRQTSEEVKKNASRRGQRDIPFWRPDVSTPFLKVDLDETRSLLFYLNQYCFMVQTEARKFSRCFFESSISLGESSLYLFLVFDSLILFLARADSSLLSFPKLSQFLLSKTIFFEVYCLRCWVWLTTHKALPILTIRSGKHFDLFRLSHDFSLLQVTSSSSLVFFWRFSLWKPLSPVAV